MPIPIKLKVQLKLMGMSLVFQVFGHKPKYLTHLKLQKLMRALDEKSVKTEHARFLVSIIRL